MTLPALAVIMSLSTMGVSGNVFRSPRSLIVPGILGILMSYVVLAGFILGISAIIIHEENIWKVYGVKVKVTPGIKGSPLVNLF